MAKVRHSKKLEAVHSRGMTRFNNVQTREQDQRSLAVKDALFAHSEDGQWEEREKTNRRDRPRYTVNRVAPAIDQITGNQRQNRAVINVQPSDGSATKETAKIFAGIIRSIESQSQASNAYDNGFDEMVTGGYGGWEIFTEHSDNDTFNQDIRIGPIEGAATSLYFGPAKAYDKRDAKYAFRTLFVPIEDFKEDWPDATVTDFQQQEYIRNTVWFHDGMIRIAKYWEKQPITKTIAQLSDGRIIDLGEEEDVIDELAIQGITVIQSRKVDSFKIVSYIMNGVEVLEDAKQWAGKFIPLVPIFGKVTKIEGKEFVRGLTRLAKDPGRIYNYVTSANIEAIALAPKDPIWLTSKQVGPYKKQFEEYNVKNSPFLFYEHHADVPPPTRTGAPAVQQALLAAGQQAAQDIHATTGLHAASMGDAPQLLSEKSIIAQAQKGDRGSFVYDDNYIKSINYTGDILVDLIPRIMDRQQQVRILGIDGASEIVAINEKAFKEFNEPILDKQTGKQVIVNDLSQGKYDTTVTTGPAFATKKEEELAQLIELNQVSPDFAAISLDLVASSLSLIDSEELIKRSRKIMIQRGIATPTEEEIEEFGLNQPQQPSEQDAAVTDNILAQTNKLNADIANKDADTLNKNAKTNQVNVDSLMTLVDTVIKKIEGGQGVTAQEVEMLTKQRDVVEESQQVLDVGPNSLELLENNQTL